MQGFLIKAPVAAAEFLELVGRRRDLQREAEG